MAFTGFSEPNRIPDILQHLQDHLDQQDEAARDRARQFKSLQEYADSTGLYQQDEAARDRARQFKSLQEYADSTGLASKNQTTPMDLGSLQGLVQGSMAKRQWAMDAQKQLVEAANAKLATQHALNLADTLTEAQSTRKKEDALNAYVASQVQTSEASDPNLLDLPDNQINAAQGGQGAVGEIDPNLIIAAAARTGNIGNPNVDRFMTGLERAANARQANIERSRLSGPVLPPVTGDLNPDMSWYGFPSTGQRGVIPKPGSGYAPAIDQTTGQPIPGQYTYANRPVSVPQVNPAQSEHLSAETAALLGKQLTEYNDQVALFDRNEQRVQTGEKNPVTGKPYTLLDQAQRRKITRLRDATLERLLPTEAAPPPARPAAVPAAAPARPLTEADFDALSKGALFVNPADGKTYRKK